MESDKHVRALNQTKERQEWWAREKVMISSPKVVKVAPDTFEEMARGRIAELPADLDLLAGTKIYIKEHDGYINTGHEIVAEVTGVSKTGIQFRKYSVLYRKDLEKIGKRNLQRIKKDNNTSITI